MSVRVVARIRPLLAKELERDVIVRADSNEEGQAPNVVKIPSPKNESEEFSFAFNSVYDQVTTQEVLFNAEVAPHIKSLFQGLDLTIFAYGVTGTGKTHTMRGGLKLADRGVIPRLLSLVFRRGKKITKDSAGTTSVAVALSYYEIYNDKVYDLLEPPEKRTASGLPLREKENKTYVVGLSEEPCADLKDFERLYIAANQNRVTASTKLNAHSSRSHAILRVKLTQTTYSEDGASVVSVRESTASCIDLAGSEDNRRTDNGKERLVESAAINKSLFVLSQCVDAIARNEKRIPYRESKMTRILSLGQNNGITVMILNLAPIRSYHLDTISSLNVSSRAKRIEVREIENEIVFKQPPRSMTNSSSSSFSSGTSLTSSSSTTSLARQPLRALTSNAHNIASGNVAAKASADKPIKAFSVYSDKASTKPSVTSIPPSAVPSRMGLLANVPKPRLSNAHKAMTVKRPSDPTEPRPSKLARPSIHPYSASNIARPTGLPTTPSKASPAAAPAMSAKEIEAIIERKVAEALAAHAQEQEKQDRLEKAAKDAAEAQSAKSEEEKLVSEDVQKRLDALERRIEDGKREDDPRTEGLRYLLLARQNKEVGDDAAALRYYEQAMPFFPGQAKLLSKMEKLKAKMARDGHTSSGRQGNRSSDGASAPRRTSSQKRKRVLAAAAAAAAAGAADNDSEGPTADDNGYNDSEYQEADADADAEDDASFVGKASPSSRRRGKGRKAAKLSSGRSTATATARLESSFEKEDGDATNENGNEADDESMLTPRKRRLLDIVNSRDVARIRGLAGVGAKKARDLVDYLDGAELPDVDAVFSGEPRSIHTLAQLRSVPGMGGRTVERAYEGLAVGV